MQLRKYHHQMKSVPSKYLIIDTDAGADDAQALVVAFHLAKKYSKTLLGITTINGNTSVDNVVKNVLITQAICGTKYPVFKGAA
jgi:inosine-uridine nucleoside N-ribohydrolase